MLTGGQRNRKRWVTKTARLIAHGSDFGAVMKMLPVFAKTMSDGLDGS